MNEDVYDKITLVKKNVMFLGWVKNNGLPIFKSDDTELYTCCNAERLKIGMWGDIYYKSNNNSGNHYFEPYKEK